MFWQTLAYLRQKHESSGKKLLFLNFDETNVLYTPECPEGCIGAKGYWKGKHPARPHRRVQPDKRRATFTYCAIIADQPAVQATLPHFLLSSAARMPRQCFWAYMALPKTKLQLLRGKSSWVTSDDLVSMLKSLRTCLAPWMAEYQPVLLLDVAGAHLPKHVMGAARKLGLQLVYCPSSTTALVQPLDVYAFAPFKLWLKRQYQEQRQAEPDGQPSLLAWLFHVSQAPKCFFAAQKWQHSFAGIGTSQVCQLHSRLAEFMHRPNALPAPVKPKAEDFAVVWPKRRKMGYAYASLL